MVASKPPSRNLTTLAAQHQTYDKARAESTQRQGGAGKVKIDASAYIAHCAHWTTFSPRGTDTGGHTIGPDVLSRPLWIALLQYSGSIATLPLALHSSTLLLTRYAFRFQKPVVNE